MEYAPKRGLQLLVSTNHRIVHNNNNRPIGFSVTTPPTFEQKAMFLVRIYTKQLTTCLESLNDNAEWSDVEPVLYEFFDMVEKLKLAIEEGNGDCLSVDGPPVDKKLELAKVCNLISIILSVFATVFNHSASVVGEERATMFMSACDSLRKAVQLLDDGVATWVEVNSVYHVIMDTLKEGPFFRFETLEGISVVANSLKEISDRAVSSMSTINADLAKGGAEATSRLAWWYDVLRRISSFLSDVLTSLSTQHPKPPFMPE